MIRLEVYPIDWDPGENSIQSECQECSKRSRWEVNFPEEDSKIRFCDEHLGLALPLVADLHKELEELEIGEEGRWRDGL